MFAAAILMVRLLSFLLSTRSGYAELAMSYSYLGRATSTSSPTTRSQRSGCSQPYPCSPSGSRMTPSSVRTGLEPWPWAAPSTDRHLRTLCVVPADAYLLTCRAESMRAFIDHIRQEYGGIEGYIRKHTKLTDDDLRCIRENLLA